MTGITLRIDQDRWRRHLQTVADTVPGLVPVAKGNGYGFGLPRLAEETEGLGLRTLAVGTPNEAVAARELFGGDVVVMLPWEPNDHNAVELARDDRVIITVSRLTDLEILANLGSKPRILVEVLTSMQRHGIPSEDLAAVAAWPDAFRFEGWTIHLPLQGNNLAEARHLGELARDIMEGPLWFSHLNNTDYLALGQQFGTDQVRMRMGTRLWLGDPGALRTTATVLDVHQVRRGQQTGYWQRHARQDGWVVVVSGGTANGIGLEAPSSTSSLRQRAISVATGGLEAAGMALSPYTIGGSKRWFIEPPHMQSSLVFVPAKVPPPQVGDEIDVAIRNTIATFDQVEVV